MSRSVSLIFICLCCKTAINVDSKYMRSFDDSVIFQMNWPGHLRSNQDFHQSSAKYGNHEALQESNSLFLTSVDNEKYYCLLPTTLSSEKTLQNDKYIGPSPLQLLTPIFAKTTCSYRLEQYWTYELCHGRFLRQYHDESTVQGKISQEYFLGKFDGYQLKTADEEFVKKWKNWKQEDKMLPTAKVEGLDLPALEVNMTEGTFCSIINKNRFTHVYYVCHEEGKHEIYSLKESSSCEYEVVILSPLLCAHPDFRIKSAPDNDIYCHAVDGSPRKPERLIAIEQDAERFQQGDSDKYVWNNEEQQPPVTKSPVVEDPHDSKLVQDFLNGEYCLQGGTGWWTHEFCYGKKVEQFHEDKNGARTSILLGSWNVHHHLQWLEQNSQKRPRPGQILRHVSHLYSLGSFCDEVGKPRQVEVKLKCKEVKGRSNSISLYLLEPKTCEYILGVESPIICPLLETADEDGLLHPDFKS